MCGAASPDRRLVRTGEVRAVLAETAERREPGQWNADGWVCADCLTRVRLAHGLEQLERERGELSAVEREIAQFASSHAHIVEELEEGLWRGATAGERAADSLARIGGSWRFVLGFIAFLIAWIVANAVLLGGGRFDPYPFILLNLVLSCLAALQAPVIMMAQNRVAARDRAQADQDFRVNLKAEMELVGLHHKVDHLLHVQWERMVELQELQLEILAEIAKDREPAGPPRQT